MKDLITKRYVRALFESLDKSALKTFLDFSTKLNLMFQIEKFKIILQSPNVSKEQKLELVLLALSRKNKKIQNFMKILSENDRLMFFPYIHEEFKRQVAWQENIHEGEVFSNWEVSKEQLAKLEEGFSKRFGAIVKLKANTSNYPGLKIAIDSLGVEASFSIERLKAQITEHILKAI